MARALAPLGLSLFLLGLQVSQPTTAQAASSGWTVTTTPNVPTASPPGVYISGAPAGAITAADAALPERVGRVAVVNGAAQIWDSQDGQWTPLQFNRLVAQGDRIRTSSESQVEVQIGTLALYVGPQSNVEFLRLDAQVAQVRLNQGHVVARVRTPEWARDLQLLTSELAAQAATPGLYRVDRDTIQGGRSAAAALRGHLILNAADSRLQVAAGQRLEVMGAAAGGGLRSTTLLTDGFASWVSTRDQVPEANGFAGVAPLREMTGVDVLDRHGRWESHPEVGWVWYPASVRAGWEPFRDGRWVWVKPWGWVWVDDTPWGFAPSNYGRWLQWNNRWVWSPGPGRSRPLPPVAPPSLAAPVLRPREDVLPVEVPTDHENRRVRTPRVDGWIPGPGRTVSPPLGVVPGALPPVGPAPSAGQVTAPPTAPNLEPSASGFGIVPSGAERPSRPDRRHGFERPSERPSERPAERPFERAEPPSRSDRPDIGRPSPRPQERDRGEKPDRPRQLAQ